MTEYYDRAKVSGSANTETTTDIITSTEEEPKHVNFIKVREVTGTLQGDAKIVVYVEREKVVNMKIVSLKEANNSDTLAKDGKITIDMDLPQGQDLTVGHVSGGTASDLEFAVNYNIKTGR